jgi:hypothetical protein
MAPTLPETLFRSGGAIKDFLFEIARRCDDLT